MEIFKDKVSKISGNLLKLNNLRTVQVNLGNKCNQKCSHCHIEGSKDGNKMMNRMIIKKIIKFLAKEKGLVLDITGGCPELNPNLKYLIKESHKCVSKIMVRSNLTVLLEKYLEWVPAFYKKYNIILNCSLPCYTKENVDKQRGVGVFEKSIKVLKLLNEIGYGKSLELNLIYNPGGDFLPMSQDILEKDYKKNLWNNYGIVFNRLYTITNAPIGRFKNYLDSKGKLNDYIDLLIKSFNPDALERIMCRTLISIDWQGNLYNCDFNQPLLLPLKDKYGNVMTVNDIESVVKNNFEIDKFSNLFSI